MNRTTSFLVIAAALGLVALVVKLPGPSAVVAPGTPVEPVKATEPVKEAPKSKKGSLTLEGKLSHPYVTQGTSDVFLSLDVTGVNVPGTNRSPVNLAVVIDRSGSMAGEKMVHARKAALALVDQLNAADRLSVVHYGNDVSVFSGVFVTDENKRRLKSFIARIQDEGGTNIGEGLAAGKAQLDKGRSDFKVNRLILLSDGQPTVGITSASGLTKLVGRFHSDGTTVTSIGVGLDFNEDLMQRMAEVGGGSYAYLENSTAIARVFEKDLSQAGTSVARDVTLSLTLPAGVRFGEVLGRASSVAGNTVLIPLPDFSAKQIEKLVVRVSVQAPGTAPQALDVAQFKLDYRDLLAEQPAEASLKLAAMVTADATVAQARRDKAAVVDATRAQSAVNYQRAAEFLGRGEGRRATEELAKNEKLFDDVEPLTGNALETDRLQNQHFYGVTSAQATAPPEARSAGTKAMKVQSLKSSGYGASVY